MNITVNTRHMQASSATIEYAETKAAKLPKYYGGIHSIEVILDIEAGQPKVELIVHAAPKLTFVAHHREEDMYASIDQCIDKVKHQIKRHKGKSHDPLHAAAHA